MDHLESQTVIVERIYHCANGFWRRWKKEFLTSLQSREERNKPRRNLEIVSIALLKTCTDIRNHLPMENVANHETDKNSLV